MFQFCKDTGLAYNHNGIVTAFDIWQRLENWYIDNGTLSFEESSNGKVKAIWQEQSKPSDKTVKAINQALPRIKALFPKAKLTTVPTHQVSESYKHCKELALTMCQCQ
ncbi:hypothetical protein [Nostoc sp. MS1]|uniref:hypothetical protein n=1 Tax=Nostoc sp. MS1 TaxID=2764711 RepID=UPI001CC693E2|nr:hypothetical protein [Nostoc sp. MS1]BCL40310.1 hypothetical protein NSMS1_67570 [Nostoc sp. MS1]